MKCSGKAARDVQLVDIRSREHMALGYIKGAALIPAEELEMTAHHLLPDKSKPVLLYCESGHRSLFTGLPSKRWATSASLSMAGGMTAWREAGYDVENETLLTPGPAHPLQQANAPSRGGRGGSIQAPERAGAARRRRGSWLVGRALPCRRRSRHHRHSRFRPVWRRATSTARLSTQTPMREN